jgi:hypothetical protein
MRAKACIINSRRMPRRRWVGTVKTSVTPAEPIWQPFQFIRVGTTTICATGSPSSNAHSRHSGRIEDCSTHFWISSSAVLPPKPSDCACITAGISSRLAARYSIAVR